MRALCIDPGETVGWSIFEDWELGDAGQDGMWDFVDGLWLDQRSQAPRFDLIICEDWAIYPWKAQDLAWDKCRTARAIGAIELICRLTGTSLKLQPAEIKDTAVAAGAEELFLAPRHENRHANDSIMHGVYYRLTEKS